MKYLLSNEEMQKRDAEKTASPGMTSQRLMETAAHKIIEIANTDTRFNFYKKNPLIVCGLGNNGGDGFAIARFVKDVCTPTVLYVGNPDKSKCSEECLRQFELAEATGVKIVYGFPESTPDFIIDAIFGTGIDREITGDIAEIIKKINSFECPKLSVDIPSGISGSTGAVLGCAVKADVTVTVSDFKRGLFIFPGTEFTGEIKVAEIGIPHTVSECTSLEPNDIQNILPARIRRSNKGSYGRIAMFVGCDDMCGAAYLSAKACYRSGAGIVEIITSKANRDALTGLLPEAIVTDVNNTEKAISAIERASAVVCGCGIGTSEKSKSTLELILKHIKSPLLLDADALNILSQYPNMRSLVPANTVITPHPGEMSRLTGLSITEILSNMLNTAVGFSNEYRVVTVLKDAHTVITDGRQTRVNLYGNSGMATGGSGDVLSGIIGAFLGLKINPFDAASLGVLVHSLAGDTAAKTNGERSMIASDIIESLKYFI